MATLELRMEDFLLHLRLDDIQYLLKSGNPPIILQLLCINTLLMIVMIFRRMRTKTTVRRHSTYVMQWFLLAACFAVVSEQQWLPHVERGANSAMFQLNQMVRP